MSEKIDEINKEDIKDIVESKGQSITLKTMKK